MFFFTWTNHKQPASMLKYIFILFTLLFSFFGASAQTFTSSNLPLIIINTGGQTIVDEPKITAEMGIVWNGPGKRNSLSDQRNNYNGKIGIEIRGSSSQSFPKKGYGLETRAADLSNNNVSLLGMPAENDWILYGPYTDKTMIRDVLSYTLDASFGRWAPRCRYVELFLNGSYEGIYVLIEKIKQDKSRVNIAKLTVTENAGEDLTGGYIIKIDKTTGSGGAGWYSSYLNTTKKTYYQYDYPQPDVITNAQMNYIQTYIRAMENALYNENFKNSGNYHEYLNDSSFIDFMIINELAKNIDGYRLSSYLYKDKNNVVNCGPIWDFNLTYGNANYLNGWIPTGFQYQVTVGTDNWQNPFWWGKLMKDQAFVTKLKNRWTTLRQKELSNQRITFVIDSLTSLIAEARERNYQRWTGVIGYYIWPNWYIGPSYDSEVSWMKNWISQRLAFLDQQWPGQVTGTDVQPASLMCSAFPNPFSNELTVLFNNEAAGNVVVEIYTMNGVLLKRYSNAVHDGNIRLTFSGHDYLAPGLYVLKLTRNSHVILTDKIVKR